jgi:hypothetical protein
VFFMVTIEAGLFKLDRLRPFRNTRRRPSQSLLKKNLCCCFSDVMRAYTKSQSTVCEDLRLALSRVSEFCPGVVLTFCSTSAAGCNDAIEYGLFLQEYIPTWAFCLTESDRRRGKQGQEMFGNARILFPCPKRVNS